MIKMGAGGNCGVNGIGDYCVVEMMNGEKDYFSQKEFTNLLGEKELKDFKELFKVNLTLDEAKKLCEKQ